MPRTTSTFSSASGDGYELQMGRFARILAGKFLDFAGLQDDGHILDAGCGTGALSAEILRRTTAVEITGVDISAAYVAHAATTTPDPRASFSVGDVTNLEFDDAMFGQVYSQLVLMFIPDANRALQELIRVTKPGGTVSATLWDMSGGLMFNRIMFDAVAFLDPSGEDFRAKAFNRPLSQPGELGQAWRAAGLVDCREGELTIRTNFQSFDDYWAPYDGSDGPTPAYLRSISEDLQKRVKDVVRRSYLGGGEDGPRSFAATSWVVTGCKPG